MRMVLNSIALICLIMFGTASAQVTVLRLPSANNTSSFDIEKNDSTKVFRVFANGGFYLTGTSVFSPMPLEGPGKRILWHPSRSAFRVGEVTGSQWDDANVSQYSIAMGYNVIASDTYALAFGRNNTASGQNSTVFGRSNIATGVLSTAFGENNTTSGFASFSTGSGNSVSGSYSIVMGHNSIVSGSWSAAIGREVTASGSGSFALGNKVSTNNREGAFILGDYTSTLLTSSSINQMSMRFSGGYRFFTNSAATIGAQLPKDGNSWSTISDSTKKENFLSIDGEEFLSNLSKLKLGSWNYKSQKQSMRHYGPMAQEIFEYFGKDGLGEIGNDTLIASADLDGIIMICLQALESRTAQLKDAIEKITILEKRLVQQDESAKMQMELIRSLREEFTELQQKIEEYPEAVNYEKSAVTLSNRE